MTLRLHATRHHGRLGGMETTNSTTGYGDEERREQGLFQSQTLSAPVSQTVPHLGQDGMLQYKHDAQSYNHEEHGQGKEGIDTTYDFVNGHHRCGDVVGKNDEHPHHAFAPDATQNNGWAINKERSHKHHHKHGKKNEGFTCSTAQIATSQFGQPLPVVTQREHTAYVIMNCSPEDASKHYPQVGRWTKPHAHDSTEDGTCACNVQELNHEDSPPWKHNIVYAISLSDGCRLTVVGTKYAFYHTTVNHVTQHQGYETNQECYHLFTYLIFYFYASSSIRFTRLASAKDMFRLQRYNISGTYNPILLKKCELCYSIRLTRRVSARASRQRGKKRSMREWKRVPWLGTSR